jgi:ariadne-1
LEIGVDTLMTNLECGHAYCNSCWSQYLTTKIMDEGASQTITCPTTDCDTLVDDNTVYRIIGSADVILKYQVSAGFFKHVVPGRQR